MEGWERAIVGALTTGLTVYVLSLLYQSVRTNAARVDQRRVLEYGPGMKWFVILCWIGTVALLVLLTFLPDANLTATLIMGGMFGGAVLTLHLEFYYVRITYDGEGIQTRSGWRRNRTIPWDDIQKAWYSKALQWYVIQTAHHGRIRLHDFLDGRESLLNELRRRGISVQRNAWPR